MTLNGYSAAAAAAASEPYSSEPKMSLLQYCSEFYYSAATLVTASEPKM